MKFRASLALAAIVAMSGPSIALADAAVLVTPSVMRSQSELVVRGRVASMRAERVVLGGRSRIVTRVTLDVLNTIQGDAPPRVTFFLHGGQIGNLATEVPGEAQLREGEVWDLHLMRGGDRLWIHSMARGAQRVSLSPYKFRTYEDTDRGRQLGITGPLSWRTLPIHWSAYEDLTPDVDATTAQQVMQRAFNTWTMPSCTDLQFAYDGLTPDAIADNDDVTTVQWFESGWTSLGYSMAQIGVTEVTKVQLSDGWHFIEADMSLNGEQYTWVADGRVPGTDQVDMEAIIVHEAGHLIGMKHPCEPGGADGAPACPSRTPDDAPAMYPGETFESGRTLKPDDVAGLCYLYPGDPCTTDSCPTGLTCRSGACVVGASIADAGVADASARATDASTHDGADGGGGDGGCSIASSDARSPIWLALAAMLMLARRRRRA